VVTYRHDLSKQLAKFFRNAGAVVAIEPRILESERSRPDLDITFAERELLVDVTVVHPSSPQSQTICCFRS